MKTRKIEKAVDRIAVVIGTASGVALVALMIWGLIL